MRKFFLSVFIILLLTTVGILFILPYGLGFLAQNKYLQVLDMFSKSSGIHLVLLDYQRGWFSSEATIKVTTDDNVSTNQALIIKQNIQHGPIF